MAPSVSDLPGLTPWRGAQFKVGALLETWWQTRRVRPRTLRHRLLEVLVNLVEEALGGEPLLVGAHQQRQVLGHVAGFHGGDADLLERIRELGERGVVVELGAMRQAPRPGEDGGHRVGGGLLALLVLTIVARYRAVRGL